MKLYRNAKYTTRWFGVQSGNWIGDVPGVSPFPGPTKCGPCQHIAAADRIAPNGRDHASVRDTRVGDRGTGGPASTAFDDRRAGRNR
jgi:hypothetical protein